MKQDATITVSAVRFRLLETRPPIVDPTDDRWASYLTVAAWSSTYQQLLNPTVVLDECQPWSMYLLEDTYWAEERDLPAKSRSRSESAAGDWQWQCRMGIPLKGLAYILVSLIEESGCRYGQNCWPCWPAEHQPGRYDCFSVCSVLNIIYPCKQCNPAKAWYG